MRMLIVMYRLTRPGRMRSFSKADMRSIVSTIEFGSSAEDFERDERQKFGQDGFEMMVEWVNHLENELGIDDLAG
jgi:hypothetical protein